ncbi:MAG: hypothetical protein OXT69_01160 [Candidatus Poribacteria bacterium]|nr:hypothetical protein [Candidatus Poribacteria bacterium]
MSWKELAENYRIALSALKKAAPDEWKTYKATMTFSQLFYSGMTHRATATVVNSFEEANDKFAQHFLGWQWAESKAQEAKDALIQAAEEEWAQYEAALEMMLEAFKENAE